jgi:hypothetical protein
MFSAWIFASVQLIGASGISDPCFGGGSLRQSNLLVHLGAQIHVSDRGSCVASQKTLLPLIPRGFHPLLQGRDLKQQGGNRGRCDRARVMASAIGRAEHIVDVAE